MAKIGDRVWTSKIVNNKPLEGTISFIGDGYINVQIEGEEEEKMFKDYQFSTTPPKFGRGDRLYWYSHTKKRITSIKVDACGWRHQRFMYEFEAPYLGDKTMTVQEEEHNLVKSKKEVPILLLNQIMKFSSQLEEAKKAYENFLGGEVDHV
jgi:acylphosphatase